MSNEQTIEQEIAFAKAMIEIMTPISLNQRDTIAEFLVDKGICATMAEGVAQVEAWSRTPINK